MGRPVRPTIESYDRLCLRATWLAVASHETQLPGYDLFQSSLRQETLIKFPTASSVELPRLHGCSLLQIRFISLVSHWASHVSKVWFTTQARKLWRIF
jgi:hypothetical protein